MKTEFLSNWIYAIWNNLIIRLKILYDGHKNTFFSKNIYIFTRYEHFSLIFGLQHFNDSLTPRYRCEYNLFNPYKIRNKVKMLKSFINENVIIYFWINRHYFFWVKYLSLNLSLSIWLATLFTLWLNKPNSTMGRS